MSKIHELGYLAEKVQDLKDTGVYRKLPVLESPCDAEIVLNGKSVINLSSNNYLGFANHPRIKEAAKRAIDTYGVGSGAVGNTALHEELDRTIATFKREDAAIAFQSGFNCNAGAIQAITEKGDLIISDSLNHASIIDGCRLSRADKTVFQHSDMEDLERVLKERRENYRNVLIITDGVFSMDGDIAPLDKLYAVAEKHGVITMVDDAHGEGVLGRGKGIVAHFGLHGRFDLEMGTLSKAFGVVGGSLAGKKLIIDYLRQKARPFLFSSAVTPADTAACLAAIELVEESPELVDKLWENAEYFKAGMKDLGFDTGKTETPIVPVMLGEAVLAKTFSRRLFEEGIFAMALGFPTVPRGKARIRVMNTAAHSREDLDIGLAAFEKVGKELGVI